MTTETETRGFQTEVQQLLKLMIHSLYSNRDIFLRELISNASDAADKLRFQALQDDKLYEGDSNLKIRVEYNKEAKTVTVLDNGIGMSRKEVIEDLGTIAKSGTKKFFENLTGDKARDSELIGQFGVGFYSAFIVSKRVEVTTRLAGLASDEGVRWSSDGESEYTVETVKRPKRGTRVVLSLRDEFANDFLDGYALRRIIKMYSDHISIPIVMSKEDEKDPGEETINSATALWRRSKQEVREEEYRQFYSHVSHDTEPPLTYIHNRVEGKLEYSSLLYIPARVPFDLWDRERRHGVKLYVKRVFIMDNAEMLMPPWLRFVKGVVDCDDLPLNISREILQHNKSIDSMRTGCTKKVLNLLIDMAKKDPDKYATFWSQFGKVLKEGILEGTQYQDEFFKLFRFSSSHSGEEDQTVSLADYVARMLTDQKAIYYITAENFATAKNSPHLEIFNKKGIEILLLTDPVDEWVTSTLNEYEGKSIVSVAKGELDLADIEDKNKTSGVAKQDHDTKQSKALVQKIKQALGERVKEARTTNRLTQSPACLVVDEHDMGRRLEQILKVSGQTVPSKPPILEINPVHPVILLMGKEDNAKQFDEWAQIVFDQALLSEGGKLENPARFVQQINRLMLALVDSTGVSTTDSPAAAKAKVKTEKKPSTRATSRAKSTKPKPKAKQRSPKAKKSSD